MSDPTAIRTVRFRVLPGSPATARALNNIAGACRFVWNQTLADTDDLYRIARMNGAKPPGVSFFSLGKAFTELRNATPWLRDYSFHVVRYSLKRQADAWAAFLAGRAGRPRFKSRYAGADGCNGQTIGVDMNVRQIATSDGVIDRLPDLSRLEARARRYQRMVSRRRNGSNRRARAKALLSRTAAEIAAVRGNWQHQASRRIAEDAEVVCIEDLRVKAMAQGHSGLNREILATGWGAMRAKLKYKCATVVAVNPAYTSQTCAECGHAARANRPSQSEFECASCGHKANADVNAARNIMASGIGAAGRGGRSALADPVNRQIGGRMAA
ncbi:MAG: transposase [Gammaproteobacteria bacterium]|nr:transposase [Gammaproteobacteria bacterium]